ncbi:MAG TPA: hypothetical protein VH186_23625 [Chloroflexia bacterium]|nr:hypothetical protein [Chloroflexia bacterium]
MVDYNTQFQQDWIRYDSKEQVWIRRFIYLFVVLFPIVTGLGMGLAIWLGEGTKTTLI